jgi:hypothetical protein
MRFIALLLMCFTLFFASRLQLSAQEVGAGVIISTFNPDDLLGDETTDDATLNNFLSSSSFSDEGTGFGAQVSGKNQIFTVPYSFTFQNLKASVFLPVVLSRTDTRYDAVPIDSKNPSKGYKVAETKGTTRGLGDLTVSLGYLRVFESLRLGVNVFVKTPTGKSNARNNGVALPLGTGTWDFLPQIAIDSIRMGRYFLGLSGLYKFNTVGKRELREKNNTLFANVETRVGNVASGGFTIGTRIRQWGVFAGPVFTNIAASEVKIIFANPRENSPKERVTSRKAVNLVGLNFGLTIPFEDAGSLDLIARVPLVNPNNTDKFNFQPRFNINIGKFLKKK